MYADKVTAQNAAIAISSFVTLVTLAPYACFFAIMHGWRHDQHQIEGNGFEGERLSIVLYLHSGFRHIWNERMIFHIPHASTHIPDDVRKQFCLSDAALENELRLMTDWYTDDLFAASVRPQDQVVKFPVSRLVVDPERFADDALEVMSQVGMGAVYTQTSQGAPLRIGLTAQMRQSLIEAYYQPHHDNFHRAVERELESLGYCLIIDCHSFPAQPLPYELEQSSDRPDICLGSDDFHSPPDLVAYLNEAFSAEGYRVSVNHPFAGTLVPEQYHWKNKRVRSVMIEVNRSLYMDEKTGEKKACFADLQKTLQNVLGKLAQLKTPQQKPVGKLRI